MEFDSFQTLFVNTEVDFDKVDGAQCVDLVQYWNRALGNQTPFSGNAIDIQGQTLNGFYQWEANTPDNTPPKGAIIVFGEPYGQYTDADGTVKYNGHVVIRGDQADVNSFQAFEQNDGEDGSAQIKTYNYTGVIGWLTPVNLLQDYRANLETCLTQHTDLVNAANEKDVQIGDLNTKLTESEVKNAELTTQIETLQTASTATQGHITELEAQVAAQSGAAGDPAPVTTETLNQHFPTLAALITEFKKLMGHA